MGVRFRLSNRMSVVRQVPRVLRKDYASMRWWKDQQPLETQDKSVATFRGGFWEAMIHPWFYTGPKHLMNFPSDPPAERLMEGHAWGDRPRFGRYNTFTYYGRFSVTASSIMTVVTLVILNKGYKSKGSCQRCPRFYCSPLRRCSFEKLIYSLILSAVPSISLSKIEFNC